MHQHVPKIIRISNLCLFFYSFSGCRVIDNFVIFCKMKVEKPDLGTMLPTSGRKWQLIYPNCSATTSD
jgi:hypothetical protein